METRTFSFENDTHHHQTFQGRELTEIAFLSDHISQQTVFCNRFLSFEINNHLLAVEIMALSVVGGALLSAFIEVVFDKLASPELVNFIRWKKPDKLLQKMRSQLLVNLDLKDIPVENNQPWKPQPTSLEDRYHIYGRYEDKETIMKLVLEDSSDGEEVSIAFPKFKSSDFRADELSKGTKINRKTRHLSFTRFSDPVSDIEIFETVKFSRTFLPINYKDSPFNNEKAPRIIGSMLKYLRVLSFRDFQSVLALPDSIGELIHLRYLNLSYTGIATLPESLCNLYNLQTLKLYCCSELTKLPGAMQNLVNLRHLEILNTSIKEMPKAMRKLNQMQNLDFYIAGKHIENSIKELRGLPNLHGSFCIQKLENVTQGEEALEARLMDKKHINDLSLEWSIRNDNSTNFQIELDVLSNLQPHQDLKSLSISGYKGTRFPEWMENCSYYCMTILSLHNCNNCSKLPSLGQLLSLRRLHISNMISVKTIDAGFYKKNDCSSVTPFPSLESLYIYNMPCWEAWVAFDSEAFLVLKDLYIQNCPKLKGDLPDHLPALQTLAIRNCELLVSSVPGTPTLRTLEISESNKVAFHSFPLLVERIEIEGSPVVESMMEAITNIQPTCLHHLSIKDCSSDISFPGDHLPISLKTLIISGLNKLKFPMQHKHELLESLSVNSSCDSLTSLPLVSFPNLIRLQITNCENMESLSVLGSDSFKSLSSFEIGRCPNFVSFSGEALSAPNLTRFIVYDCDKLKSLPNQMCTLLPKMEYLSISNCQQLESFPEGGMPPNLRIVEINNCEKLLSGQQWVSKDIFTYLKVWGPCDGINSFPKEGLLPPSLTSLQLFGFSSLETLECKGLLHLTSLRELHIQNEDDRVAEIRDEEGAMKNRRE
ncbi:putative disease resistance protein [Vigna angularis]|uniref:Putative disease resistance protein n=1 Tax=Phaseolus angularis TaxID=3914 RepID=A0A8T0JSB4_PHAAN|nr:putative disease resistance protein [Vigna angularis]